MSNQAQFDPNVDLDLNPTPLDPEDVVQTDDGLVLLFSRLFIIFGGIIPFTPQYIQIYESQDASGFSTMVCFVVICSNILRIAYWFGHAFDVALLLQSIIMTFVMLILLELCLRVERRHAESTGAPFQEYSFSDFDTSKFWAWTDMLSYIQVTLLILVVSCTYAVLFAEQERYIEPLGFVALLTESALGLPQILKNLKNKSTEGMNILMIILWTVGDVVKAFFFFRTDQPFPFKLCATIQIIMDATLFAQVFIYRK